MNVVNSGLIGGEDNHGIKDEVYLRQPIPIPGTDSRTIIQDRGIRCLRQLRKLHLHKISIITGSTPGYRYDIQQTTNSMPDAHSPDRLI